MPTDIETVKQTVDTLEAKDLNAVEKPASLGEGVITSQQILDAVEKLRDPEANGGDIRIAQACSMSHATVKLIKQAMAERLAALAEV